MSLPTLLPPISAGEQQNNNGGDKIGGMGIFQAAVKSTIDEARVDAFAKGGGNSGGGPSMSKVDLLKAVKAAQSKASLEESTFQFAGPATKRILQAKHALRRRVFLLMFKACRQQAQIRKLQDQNNAWEQEVRMAKVENAKKLEQGVVEIAELKKAMQESGRRDSDTSSSIKTLSTMGSSGGGRNRK